MSGEQERWFDDEAGRLVRPYTVSGGRTQAKRGDYDLIAVVTAIREKEPAERGLEPEHLQILRLAREPAPVADIVSETGLPLGVVRILLSDLDELGLVRIRKPPAADGGPSAETLREVLHGLRAL